MTTNKQETLDILGTLHYVLAGITFLFSFLPVFHLGFGLLMLLAPEVMEGGTNGNGEEITPEDAFIMKIMGGFFVAISATIMLAGFALALVSFIAGRKLKARRSRTFCIVVAAVECIFFPLGTALGVFTIINLVDEDSAPLFEN
jgi:hypothetical protein